MIILNLILPSPHPLPGGERERVRGIMCFVGVTKQLHSSKELSSYGKGKGAGHH